MEHVGEPAVCDECWHADGDRCGWCEWCQEQGIKEATLAQVVALLRGHHEPRAADVVERRLSHERLATREKNLCSGA